MSSAKVELVRSYMEEIENTKRSIVMILHEKASNVACIDSSPKTL